MIKGNMAIHHPLPNNFSSELLVIHKGKGVHVTDISGKTYLDFGSGIAVNSFGYADRKYAKIASRQVRRIAHTSNYYTTLPVIEFGEMLVKSGNFAAVQFMNSGSEANETALKFARAYAKAKKGPKAVKLLSFDNAFHGRSMGSLSVTPKEKYQAPFTPLVPECYTTPYNDCAALKKALSRDFAAVIVEVIQGEGGLWAMTEEFASCLNDLCAKYDIILIADEVQTGLGRLGTLYGSEAVGLKPDIITVAKPLGAGLPLSAALVPAKVNDILLNGQHGTTFGGNPVAAALGIEVWKRINAPGFLAEVREKSAYLHEQLEDLKKAHPALIGDIRGRGMLAGIQMKNNETNGNLIKLYKAAMDNGLLVLVSGSDILRIAPPLVIRKKQIDKGIGILDRLLTALEENK
ncbi:MAG: aspartate aminotransferase family protein [Spirochaetales bacterium]|nr:aspartate aminotransferase family protein [Spirochaetales bacterium]